MKFTFLSILGVSVFLSHAAANTPDICTENIENLRKIRPSEVDDTGRVGPEITVGSTVYNNDEHHMVIGAPITTSRRTRRLKTGKKNSKSENKAEASASINVFMPGTTDWPGLSSCLLESVASNGIPTIGLTYAYLRRGDGFRNTRCGSLTTEEEKVECLTEQHNDAIYGGSYGSEKMYLDAEFWQEVDKRDSIAGRLGMLLCKLHNDHPTEGWDEFFTEAAGDYPDFLPEPVWSKISFSGHSQGAGHAAFLAQTKTIHGAALISGPQDECLGCDSNTEFWIDEEFETDTVTAFAYGDASEDFLEPTLPLMEDNWKRMNVWPSPMEVKNVDTSFGNYDVCKTPIVSSIAYQPTSPCGRKGHCATALDDSSPVVYTAANDEDPIYLFAMNIWPKVTDVDSCK